MKADLSRATLVAFDGGQCPELTELAITDSLDQASFAEVVVCSPDPIGTAHGRRHIRTKRWTDRLDLCRFLWYELPWMIDTEFVLMIHFDCWILDGSLWEPGFMDYDYIGAPWWYDDGLNVGCGTLRSLRLMHFLARRDIQFPLKHPEDHFLCRHYRPQLETLGFRWPSEQVASRFMLECTRPAEDSKHFMFHDLFNFPAVLSGERLKQRMDLVYANEYLRKNPDKIKQLEDGRKADLLPRLAS